MDTAPEARKPDTLAEVNRKRAAANKEANRLAAALIKRGGPFTEADFAAVGRAAFLAVAFDLRSRQIGNANTSA